MMGVKKVNTSAYHPQSDGLVERFNRTLIDMMSKSVAPGVCEWDEKIPYVLFAYRATTQSSTGESPFRLLYGQIALDDYMTNLTREMSAAWKLAQEQVQKAQKRHKLQHDKRATTSQFVIGERVFLYVPGLKAGPNYKLARPFKGPYIVVASYPNGVELVPADKPRATPIRVSLDRVRRCAVEITNIGNLAGDEGGNLRQQSQFSGQQLQSSGQQLQSLGQQSQSSGQQSQSSGQQSTVFRTAVAVFRTVVTVFRTAITVFRTAVTVFRTTVAVFRTASTVFRTAVTVFRTGCSLPDKPSQGCKQVSSCRNAGKIYGSRKQHARFASGLRRDFTDFTKDFGDFRISTKISGLRERFQISREISGKVYEISGSGGPLVATHCLHASPEHPLSTQKVEKRTSVNLSKFGGRFFLG